MATLNKLLKASTRAPASTSAASRVEIGQVGRLDLQHRHVQPRIAAQQLGLELPAVGQGNGDVVGVQGMAQDSEDVALGRDEHAALIGFQAVESARPVNFDHFGLRLIDRLGGRIALRRGRRPRVPETQAKPQA